jgi:cytochrome c biogenesis protein CcdA
MNPQQQEESREVNKVNRFILGIFLLFVILGAGFYGSMKFMEVYGMLAAPVAQNTITTKISEGEKVDLLASVASSNADIEEREKLSMIRDLALQGSINIKSRNAALDSLR